MSANGGAVAPAVLANILGRLAALEAQGSPVNEQSVPNYLTTDNVGRVGADFSGLINALGIVLPAGTGNQPQAIASNQIVWQDVGNGVLVANVQGWNDTVGTNQGIKVTSTAEADVGQNYAILSANQHSGSGGSATLQISQQNNGASGPPGAIGGWTEVDVFVGAFAAMIMDSAGRSSFVQLGVPGIPAQMCIDGGSGLFSTAFAVPAGTVNTVATFFTARNSWTAATMIGAFSGLNTSPITWDFIYNGGNSFSVRVWNNSVAGVTGNWLGAVLGH